jgi:hypothetical protein
MSWLTYSICIQFWISLFSSMTRGDRIYPAARERSGAHAIAYTRHLGVKHFQELVAMTLPHTNAGLMSRLHATRFTLALRAGLPLANAHPNSARGELR